MNHRWRTVVLTLAGLVLLAVLLTTGWIYKGRWDVNRYKRQLMARGEKLTTRELEPASLPGAVGNAKDLLAGWTFQNGPLLRKLALIPAMDTRSLVNRSLVSKGKAIVVSKRPRIETFDGDYSWENLAAEIRTNSTVLDETRARLHSAQRFDFSLNYQDVTKLQLGHLGQLKSMTQRFSSAAMVALHEGKLQEADNNLTSAVEVAAVLENEPLIISQLVRVAIVALALPATWEALQWNGWTDGQLRDLQFAWEKINFAGPLRQAFEMDRAMGLNLFEDVRKSKPVANEFFNFQPVSFPPLSGEALSDWPSALFETAKTGADFAANSLREQIWKWIWSWPDERLYIQRLNWFIEATRETSRTRDYREGLGRFAALANGPAAQKKFVVSSHLLPGLLLFPKFARVEAERSLVIAAVALKRYELRNARLPASLDELVPQFLSRIPTDPYAGRPVCYRHESSNNNFMLYCIGEDQLDQLGDPTPPTRAIVTFADGLDIVWPHEATEPEIQPFPPRKKTDPPRGYMDPALKKRYGLP